MHIAILEGISNGLKMDQNEKQKGLRAQRNPDENLIADTNKNHPINELTLRTCKRLGNDITLMV